jgi:hypothetical protein
MMTVIAGAAVIAGCQPDEDWRADYTFVREGEHVTVYGYDLAESDACAGSFAALDESTRVIMDFLEADESLHYSYRWLSDEAWQGTCPSDASACASHGEPFTRSLPDMHEIVHAVIHANHERGCSSMLGEGLAEYLDGPRFRGNPLTSIDIREQLDDRVISGFFYARAGHFVSYLVERYGSHAVVELCRMLPKGSDLAAWDAASRAVLDSSLDDLIADYYEYPECRQPQYRARLWECPGEPDHVFSAEEPVVEFTADCADPRAMNSRPGKVVVTRRVYMPEAILGKVSVVAGEGGVALGRFMSQECAPCSADPQVFRDLDGLPIYSFRPGMHEFVVLLEAGADERMTLTLERPP